MFQSIHINFCCSQLTQERKKKHSKSAFKGFMSTWNTKHNLSRKKKRKQKKNRFWPHPRFLLRYDISQNRASEWENWKLFSYGKRKSFRLHKQFFLVIDWQKVESGFQAFLFWKNLMFSWCVLLLFCKSALVTLSPLGFGPWQLGVKFCSKFLTRKSDFDLAREAKKSLLKISRSRGWN